MKLFFGFFLSLLIFAVDSRAESCSFSLEAGSLKSGWTAYKTSQKTAVSGVFKQVSVKGRMKAKSMVALLSGLSAAVERESSNSGNPARDKTLAEFFFAKLAPAAISGKVKAVTDAGFTLALSLNGKHADVPMLYELNGDALHAHGMIELPAFGAQAALDSIHAKCEDLHKGTDGVSKTWPDVEITLDAVIKKVCR